MKKIQYYCLAALMFPLTFSCQQEPSDRLKLTATDALTTVSDDGLTARSIFPETGGSTTIHIESNTAWTILNDAETEWFTYQIDETEQTVSISSAEIVSDYARKGILRIQAGSLWGEIEISQQGSAVSRIKLDQEELSFPEMGGIDTVAVDSNKEWRIANAEDCEWASFTVEGSSILVETQVNQVPEEKTFTLNIVAGTEINRDSASLTIVQAPWTEAWLNAAQPAVALPCSEASGKIEIKTNRKWTVETETPWLEVKQEGSYLTFTADAGTTADTGTITVRTEDDETEPVILDIKRYDKPLILEYTIDASLTFSPSVPISTPSNVYIDWGDGSSDLMYASGNEAFMRPTHHFEEGTYEVRIYGEAGGLMTGFGNEWGKCITAIEEWGNLGFTSMNLGLCGTAIKTLPENTGEVFAKVTNFDNAFQDCTELETLPAGMFRGVQVSRLFAVFSRCSSLKEIPEDLFAGMDKLTDLTAVFMECSSLETVPAGLLKDLENLDKIVNLFAECYALREIPAGFFDHNPRLQTFTGVFRNTAIEAVPEGLFDNTPELNNLMEAFYNCSSLKSVPAGIFDRNLKIAGVYGLFSGCSALTGESPYTLMGERKVHLYERSAADGFAEITDFGACFLDCSGLDDYDSIPEDWKKDPWQ